MSCPSCGEKEQLECDFVGLAVGSLLFNLSECKSYIPYGWSELSFSDQVLFQLFILFEQYKKTKDISKFKTQAERWTNKHILAEPYFKKYFVTLAIFVKVALEKRKNSSCPDFGNNTGGINNFKIT